MLVEAMVGAQEVSSALQTRMSRRRNRAWTIGGFPLIRWHIVGFQQPVVRFDLSRFVFRVFGWWENAKTYP